MKYLLIAALAISFVSTTVAQKPEKLGVFVRSGPSAEGFTDPSKTRQDSVKDLQKKIKDSDVLKLADSESDAPIILEVLERGTKSERNGWTALSGTKQNKSSLTVRLIAGEYSTEFSGESGSRGVMTGYGAAASKVVDQLEDWVKANRAKLSEQKQQ